MNKQALHQLMLLFLFGLLVLSPALEEWLENADSQPGRIQYTDAAGSLEVAGRSNNGAYASDGRFDR